jgi:ElaB/YqjD/DUF883 family membrane-anchored ribosome-binding protein
MALGDKLKALREKATQQLEAVKQDPEQALKQARAGIQSPVEAGGAAVDRASGTVPEASPWRMAGIRVCDLECEERRKTYGVSRDLW